MSVLYNENNPYCAQALRNLIAGGIIPAGDATRALEYSQSIRRSEGKVKCQRQQRIASSAGSAIQSRMGDTVCPRWPLRTPQSGSMECENGRSARHSAERSDDTSFWQDTQDIWCDWDQKWRRTKSSIPYLVDGFPLRSHAFSAAGNAIVPQIAAQVLKAWLEEFPPDSQVVNVANMRHLWVLPASPNFMWNAK